MNKVALVTGATRGSLAGRAAGDPDRPAADPEIMSLSGKALLVTELAARYRVNLG